MVAAQVIPTWRSGPLPVPARWIVGLRVHDSLGHEVKTGPCPGGCLQCPSPVDFDATNSEADPERCFLFPRENACRLAWPDPILFLLSVKEAQL
jgi:hypothetical protein